MTTIEGSRFGLVQRLIAALVLAAFLAAPQPARAIAQRTGDFELEVDAPWRIEPRGTERAYGSIPIQISIHDGDQPNTSETRRLQQLITLKQRGYLIEAILLKFIEKVFDLSAPLLHLLGIEPVPDAFPRIVNLDRFVSLSIAEEVNGQWSTPKVFTLKDLHEVERVSGLWRWAANQPGPESPYSPPPRPSHVLCRRWAGQDCSALDNLRQSSEWNATALYTPIGGVPGSDVRLRAELRARVTEGGDGYTKVFQRILSVHLGEQPLPRFDHRWMYGDLHYHAQGTDNDGESGYAYRGVLQAMGALGLDFAFATDHASNSPQIGSARSKLSSELVEPLMRGLRDMSPDRFAFNLDWLNGASGANRQIGSYPRSTGESGRLVAPQLFLGAEVDVIPEVLAGSVISGFYPCRDLPKALLAIQQRTLYPDEYWCPPMSVTVGDRKLLLDVQGPAAGQFLSTHFHPRQHLLHLPTDPARRDAFIASNSSLYGGATRRLGEILDIELKQRGKGFAFLAHPFASASGADFGRLGPDLVPYSSAQIMDAFASPHVLGLQIWNEDGLRSADANDLEPFDAPHWTRQHQPRHSFDLQRWDVIQLWGLDRSKTSQLTWLPAGSPRRMLMAGGSDAHGDFNFRREGYFFGTSSAVDTAIGTPRNLVFVGEPAGQPVYTAAGTARPVSQSQVTDALRTGNFSVTDGPAVRIAYDVNGNHVIDDSDLPMGAVARHRSESPFDVIVEWKTTPEFAPVETIDLYLGVVADGHPAGMVYAPWRWEFPLQSIGGAQAFTQPGTGLTFVRAPSEPYWYGPASSTLAITPNPSEEYEGRRVIRIDPAQFLVGEGVCVHDSTMSSTTTTTRSIDPLDSALKLTMLSTSTGTGETPTDSGTTTTARYIDPDKVLEEISKGERLPDLPPPCDRHEFQNAERADRMFVRAEVRSGKVPGSELDCADAPTGNPSAPDQIQCIRRWAYTNPVWVNIEPCLSLRVCTRSDTEFDGIRTLDRVLY